VTDDDASPDRGPQASTSRHHGRWQTHPSTLAAVAVGGALGASARYGLGQLVPSPGDAFPLDTLVENVVGSLLLGVALVVITQRFAPTSLVRPLLAVGFLGSFTTFSAVAVEGDLMVRDGEAVRAALYWSATLALGVAAAAAGIVGALRVVRRLDRPA
jgi:fluoride exporter